MAVNELGGSGCQFPKVSDRQEMKNEVSSESRHRAAPLRHFTWDNKSHRSDSEILIESTVTEWYTAKHRSPSDKEIKFINGLPVKYCPYCGSIDFCRAGFNRSGIQRYKCNDCGRRFSPFTNTIFDEKKIPISEWIEYLLHLFEFHSVRSSSFDNRNAESTGKYWLLKAFNVLEGIQDDVILSGDVWMDETFLSVLKSKVKKRNGKKLRGISRNKIAIACAKDEDGHSVMITMNTSKPSIKSTWDAYGAHIAAGAKLIHDGEHSHSILIQSLSLKSEVYMTEETKGMSDDKNPLRQINEVHRIMKRFFREHDGYDREHLQDWLNLLWFILNGPEDKYDKVLSFIKLAVSSTKKVRYRDVMSKKYN